MEMLTTYGTGLEGTNKFKDDRFSKPYVVLYYLALFVEKMMT